MRREHRSFSKKMLGEDDEVVIDSRHGINAPAAITKSTMLLSERPKNLLNGVSSDYICKRHMSTYLKSIV